VFVTAELWAVGRGWNPVIPGRMLYPPTPMITAMVGFRDQQPKNDPFRIVGYGAALFANVPAIYGLEDIRSHDPMANGRYMTLLAYLSESYDKLTYFAQWFDYQTHLLDFLNVKFILTEPGLDLGNPERWHQMYDGPDGRIFENKAVLPRFFPVRNVILEFRRDRFFYQLKNHQDYAHTALLNALEVENDQMRDDLFRPRPGNAPEAVSHILSARNTEYHLSVKAPRYTLIASSIPSWPGWRVYRNGKRIDPITVNGAFMGFAAAPGDNDIRVVYRPWTFLAGVAISAAILLMLAIIAIRRQR
jgi:membrane protein YfhO